VAKLWLDPVSHADSAGYDRGHERRAHLHARLRRSPSPYSVPGSLPVLFFGDLFSARIATVGLNPSDQEFTDARGALLTGARQRLATLPALGAVGRASLTDAQCDEAIDWMRRYFDDGKPQYAPYFNHVRRLLAGFGASLTNGTAVHFNLVQEATHPKWSDMRKTEPEEHTRLLDADLPFLEWQVRSFPIDVVICTGKTVSDHVRMRLDVAVEETGTTALVTWWTGCATVGGRRIGFAGWNRPLHQATGLGSDGERQLGAVLREKLGC
jgi:uracil-DNA glycosylase